MLERCCYTQHFGLCSRTVDHSARVDEYWSQGVERAVSFYLDYGQLAQHSMRSRFSTVFQGFVEMLSEGHQKRSSRKTSLYTWLVHGLPLICPLLGISFKRSTDRLREGKNTVKIHICYSPAGRSVLGKTVPEVLDTARGRRPRAVLKTEGTVFPNTDRPRHVNNIFIFFLNRTKGVRKTRTF